MELVAQEAAHVLENQVNKIGELVSGAQTTAEGSANRGE